MSNVSTPSLHASHNPQRLPRPVDRERRLHGLDCTCRNGCPRHNDDFDEADINFILDGFGVRKRLPARDANYLR